MLPVVGRRRGPGRPAVAGRGVGRGHGRGLGCCGSRWSGAPFRTETAVGFANVAGRGCSGCFAGDAVVSREKSRPSGGRGGCFASEAEFSKGYRHFASVITLAKCGIAVKVRYRCESGPTASASTTGLSESGRGIGAGNHLLGQVNNLPQCTVTYPNATAHPPQQRPAAENLLPLPTPMTRCLLRCAPAQPGGACPARRGPTRPPRASGGNAPVPLITPAYRVRCAGPFLRTAPMISRSRADHAPLANRTSTEATRCCAVRSSRPVSGSEATTHSPVAEGGSAVPASTSGPACGQAGPFAGKNHA